MTDANADGIAVSTERELASVTIDDDAGKRQQKGVIGIQIEGAQRVSFRTVWLKKLS